jgi:hypothetical protein
MGHFLKGLRGGSGFDFSQGVLDRLFWERHKATPRRQPEAGGLFFLVNQN